jgi:predicted PurR-regulated permease PerM
MNASASLRDLFFGLGFVVLLAVSLTMARPWLTPIAVAVLIWFLINGLAGALGRLAPRLPRGAPLAAALTAFALGVVLMSTIITRNVGALTDGLTGVDDRLVAAAEQGLAALGLDHRLDIGRLLRGFRVEDLMTTALRTAQGVVSDVGLVLLYVAFLLVDQRFYETKLRALAPDPERRSRLRRTLKRIADETRAYLWLMFLISAGVGLATGAILWAFGVAGAGFWGFLAFTLNFIPTIGSILGVAIPAIYALLSLPDAAPLLLLVPALAAVQFVAGEVVLPRVMGERLNLSAFAILLLLVVWGAMWGPAGMFLAIPISVVLMIVFAEFESTRPIAIALSKTGRLPDGRDWTHPADAA